MSKLRYLYRYVSFESFVSLVQKQTLTLFLPEVWEDPTEKIIFDRLIEHVTDPYSAMLLQMMKWKTFCLCWSKLAESDAMWRLYSHNKMSVRIKVYEDDLLKLNDHLLSRDIQYSNEQFLLPAFPHDEENHNEYLTKVGKIIIESICRKREAFSHEQEVRLIYPLRWDKKDTDLADHAIAYFQYWNNAEMVHDLIDIPHTIEENNLSVAKQLLNVDEFQKKTLDVSYLKQPDLIRGVLVNPFAPDWFVETVATYCSEHQIPFEGKSKLYELW